MYNYIAIAIIDVAIQLNYIPPPSYVATCDIELCTPL